ncbi:hypothetical protein CDAR_445781 [Caerostris darwini]|uniref:Uncharacterized protein n=1 Tax=Caerostris darwini TaxID=1538125 RepID=A0AAV4WLV5_9ARAC|nr:hypothetical protein CDAR_445781 [Caerostris darwini]
MNILAWLYSISGNGNPPVTPLCSWEYGEPLSEFIIVGQFYEMREEGWNLKCDWIEEWTTDAMERELLFQMVNCLIPDSYTSVIPQAQKPLDLHQRPIQITNPWSTGAKQEFVTETSDAEYPSNPKHFSVALFHFGPRNLSSDSSLVLGIWRTTVRIYWSWTVLRDEGRGVDL